MTTQQPGAWSPQQHPYEPPPPAQPPPTPPKRKRGKGQKILLAIAGTVLGLFILGVLFGNDPAPTTTPGTAKAPAVQATAAPEVTEPAATEPAFDTPAIGDFRLAVKELSRQRFGSAGDNVEYRVQLVQVRDRSYDPDKEYELTYRITGSEDGAETQTMVIRGDEYEQYEGFASTRSGVKIKATPTGIEEI